MKAFKKIVLAGGSGQMGTALKDYFKDKAEAIVILSRKAKPAEGNVRTLLWDGKSADEWYHELEDAEILVNLAGKNVNCRYTEKNKKEIFDSRTNSINALSEAVKKCNRPPKLWIQCASATIYRHAEDRPMTEANGETGEGFSVEVCQLWEKTFRERTAGFTHTRKVILRTSLVLGKQEGVFPRLINLVKFGLGGRQGNGQQWVSWVHELDVASMVEWIALHPAIEGEINCTSPLPLQNKDFMKIIRTAYGAPFGLPAPAWLMEIGAFMIGTETELILKSRWVLPQRIKESGYTFKLPELKDAVKQILTS